MLRHDGLGRLSSLSAEEKSTLSHFSKTFLSLPFDSLALDVPVALPPSPPFRPRRPCSRQRNPLCTKHQKEATRARFRKPRANRIFPFALDSTPPTLAFIFFPHHQADSPQTMTTMSDAVVPQSHVANAAAAAFGK